MNEYELKEDGALSYKGHAIATIKGGELTWTSDAMRRKHANAVAELLNNGGILKAGETAAGKAEGVPAAEEVLPEAPGESVDVPAGLPSPMEGDAMEEPEEAPIPRRDAVMGEFSAEWLRHDARYLDRLRFRAKWEPFANGNPDNFKLIKKKAGFSEIHGL